MAISGNLALVGADFDDPGGVSAAGTAYVFDATTGGLQSTLNSPSPASSDQFSEGLAIDGKTAIVGAWKADPNVVSAAGEAYIFESICACDVSSAPEPEPDSSVALNNPVAEIGEAFGKSVAVSGTTTVVGAPDSSPGSAHVLNTATGNLVVTLNNPLPNSNDFFGFSVAVSGTTAVIGAYGDESDGSFGVSGAGRAYVFDTTTGNLISTLNNPSPNIDDNFGVSVAVSGTIAVVGANQDESDGTTGLNEAGRAYVFDTTTGNLISTLNNPSPNSSDHFGESVAISGATAVVGANDDESDGTTGVSGAGRAYVFELTPAADFTTFLNETPLNHPSPVADDHFGTSVSVSGNLAVIGAPDKKVSNQGNQEDAGLAYIIDVTDGSLLFSLESADARAGDKFGYSVSISGNNVVVGETFDSDAAPNAGIAYVFDASTGILTSTLNNPSATMQDQFGVSVAVSGNVAVVGAYLDDNDGGAATTDAGQAYVFDTTDGSLISTLVNPSPATDDWFGGSVAVSGTTAVIGAYKDDNDGGTATTDAGQAYVFDTTTGNLIATLNNPSPNVSDYFGSSVAVSGTIAVVGAFLDDPGALDAAGIVYVFDTTTGNPISTINNPYPNSNDRFGISVAVSGNIAVVGAENDESDGEAGIAEAGRAYVFDTTTGNLVSTLNNPSPNVDDKFGYSVAVSGTTAVVGTWWDESDGGTGVSAAGRAYAFTASCASQPIISAGCLTDGTCTKAAALDYDAGKYKYCDGTNWNIIAQ